MIRPFALAGKFALFIAVMAVLTGMSLLMVGVYLASWPIMRVSPRNRKVQSLIGLAVAGMAVARAYELDRFSPPTPATGDTDDTETSRGEPEYPYDSAEYEGWVALGPDTLMAPGGDLISHHGQHFTKGGDN